MLTRDDLIEIEARYHRADWDGFSPETAVFDIGRLLGHITVQTERIAALEAAARAVTVRGGHADGCLIRDYGGCTCGWENALGALAALLDGDT